MKTLELNLNKRLLIVESEADYFGYKDYRLKLICKGSDLTEDIANRIVSDMWKQDGTKYYNNYNSETIDFFDSALESFISAIESNGWYWGENPMQSTEPTSDLSFYDSEEDYKTTLIEWQEAESRTFNPEKCLIFEIV